MSSPDDLDNPDAEPEQPKRNFRRELEERAEQAEARAQAAERRAAIAEAGLTDLTPRQREVLAAQIGDDVSPDSVRTLAAELGWAKPADDSVPAEELAELNRVAAASTGAPSVPGNVDAEQVLQQAWQEGGQDAFMKAASSLGLPTSWEQQ